MPRPARVYLTPAPPPAVVPIAERGRILYVEDVQERLGRFPEGHARAGQYRFSRWWVLHNVATDRKLTLGREVGWWECDITAWLDSRMEATA